MGLNHIVASVEIGTTKVAVLVGDVSEDGRLSIIGHGQCSSSGVKKGMITDLRAAGDCVQSAIVAAERSAGVTLSGVFLAQTGAHLRGRFVKGGANVSSSDGIINERDIARARSDARNVTLPDDRLYVNFIRNPFLVDGRQVDEPVEHSASRLEACYWAVDGAKRVIQDQIRLIQGIDLRVDELILAGTASAAAVLQDAEKQSGCLLLDIGGGTTDYVLYRNGYIVRAGVLPVGGDHITNDLGIGLRINTARAEIFKRDHGSALALKEARDRKAWSVGDQSIGDRECSLYAAHQVMEERIREIFTVILADLNEVIDRRSMGAGVILTGGSSQIPAIADLAEKVFGVNARCGGPPDGLKEALSGPEFSTSIGLLIYASQKEEVDEAPAQSPRWLKKVVGLFGHSRGDAL